jgi:hypothetical protein
MIYCPRCGKELIPEDLKFCSGCGLALAGVRGLVAAKEKEYLVSKHNIAPSRIVIIRAGRVGGGRIQLWVVPGGAKLPRAKR